ncbi:MAG: hypothetical protein RBT65_16805 [Methanolobus sp.]|nr:hypothetical protein [Methanolobus sp.]
MATKKQKEKVDTPVSPDSVLVKIRVNYLINNIRYDKGETVRVSPERAEQLRRIGVAE